MLLHAVHDLSQGKKGMCNAVLISPSSSFVSGFEKKGQFALECIANTAQNSQNTKAIPKMVLLHHN